MRPATANSHKPTRDFPTVGFSAFSPLALDPGTRTRDRSQQGVSWMLMHRRYALAILGSETYRTDDGGLSYSSRGSKREPVGASTMCGPRSSLPLRDSRDPSPWPLRRVKRKLSDGVNGVAKSAARVRSGGGRYGSCKCWKSTRVRYRERGIWVEQTRALQNGPTG